MYKFNYSLTKRQADVSTQVLNYYQNNKNTLIYAVCGAGKTEIMVETINYAIENNKTVGVCIPRKDLVIEIGNRLKEIFFSNKVVQVYGGHGDEIYGDIIVCTSHQMHRYKNYFDLLIIDEIDAFPYYGNPLLHKIVEHSIKGNYILMSATPPVNTLKMVKDKKLEIACLHERYHMKPLPLPEVMMCFPITIKYQLKNLIKNDSRPLLIYVHSKKMLFSLQKYLKRYFSDFNIVYSGKEDNETIIENFKQHKYHFLLTTTLLERGITFKNVQVIIYNTHEPLFDETTIIQICGRVGRNFEYYEGNIYLLTYYKTEVINNVLNTIKTINQSLSSL